MVCINEITDGSITSSTHSPSVTSGTNSPMVTLVWPLFGPISGGTRLTISGQWLNFYPVTNVYFGSLYSGPVDSSER